MKIDRHNYEEFFLLYVDNELTTEQKKSVEQFIQENPDLAMELEILQQTTLQVDDSIVFDGKESLMKEETGSAINMDNYEQYLIEYLDNELNDRERIEFYKFAMAHPQVKEELSIYQQTKLQPQKEIVFANKEILYRREEKVKVITLQWWKIAVAAAVLLAIGITTITVLNKPAVVQPGVANNNKKEEKNNPATKTQQETKKTEQTNPVAIQDNVNTIAKSTASDKKEKDIPVQKTTREKEQKKIVLPALEKSNDESVAKNNFPVNNNNTITDKKQNETKIIDAIKKSDEPVKTNDVAVSNNLPKENINSKAVTPDTNQPLNKIETVKEVTENQPVYASYDEGKNKKTRGFFRKAARVFERRTNISASDEENSDKVLIGALAVKLK